MPLLKPVQPPKRIQGHALKILGDLPTGISADMLVQAGKTLQVAVEAKQSGARVLSLRVLPTSVTPVRDGVQFVANTSVDGGRGGSRPRIIDSVVTFGRKNKKLVLKDVKVPSFDARLEA